MTGMFSRIPDPSSTGVKKRGQGGGLAIGRSSEKGSAPLWDSTAQTPLAVAIFPFLVKQSKLGIFEKARSVPNCWGFLRTSLGESQAFKAGGGGGEGDFHSLAKCFLGAPAAHDPPGLSLTGHPAGSMHVSGPSHLVTVTRSHWHCVWLWLFQTVPQVALLILPHPQGLG